MTVPLGDVIKDQILIGNESQENLVGNENSEENQENHENIEENSQNQQNETSGSGENQSSSNNENSHQEENEQSQNLESNENQNSENGEKSGQEEYAVSPPLAKPILQSPRLAKYRMEEEDYNDSASNYSEKQSQTTQTDQMMTHVESIINSGKMPPPEQRDEVYEYVTEQIKESCRNRNYKRAAYFQIALDKLNERPPPRVIVDSNQAKIDNAHKQIRMINEKYDQMIQHKNAEIHSLTTQLQNNIDKEEQEYEEKWSSQEYMQQYNKPSKELLGLRKVENKYAQAGLWAEADATKSKADSLERLETEQARSRAVEDMRTGYEIMKTKHQKQLDGMEDYRRREIDLLELKRQKELKPWNLYLRRSDVINPTIRKSDTILYTPRQARYQVYGGTCTLNLGTLNFKQYVRIRPSTTRRSVRTQRRL